MSTTKKNGVFGFFGFLVFFEEYWILFIKYFVLINCYLEYYFLINILLLLLDMYIIVKNIIV